MHANGFSEGIKNLKRRNSILYLLSIMFSFYICGKYKLWIIISYAFIQWSGNKKYAKKCHTEQTLSDDHDSHDSGMWKSLDRQDYFGWSEIVIWWYNHTESYTELSIASWQSLCRNVPIKMYLQLTVEWGIDSGDDAV